MWALGIELALCPGLAPSSSAIVGKSFNLMEPRFPYPQTGDNST